jgi:purine catabolism regulator
MTVSRPFLVRHLLEDSGFELELVAGAAGVERECRGVSIGEHLDPTPWLARGFVHLTAGLALAESDDREVGARLVRRLRSAGVVGLGVSIPHYLSEIPQAMRDEADRVGLPLFAVTGNTLFRDVEQYVYDVLASEEMQRLRRSLSAQQQLLEAMAGDEAPAGLVARLASYLEATVLLVDPEGALFAGSGSRSTPSPDAGESLPDLASRAWAAYRACEPAALPRPSCRVGRRELLWREVVVDGGLRMVVLAVLEEGRAGGEFAGAMLDYAQRLIEVEVRRRLQPSSGTGEALLHELLASPEAAARCSTRLALRGIADDAPFRVAVVRAQAGKMRPGADHGPLAICASVLGKTGVRYLLAESGGDAVVLLVGRRDAAVTTLDLARDLAAGLGAAGCACAVGVSDEYEDVRGTSTAKGHALQAVACASRGSEGAAPALCSFDQLGPRRRLLDQLGDADLERLVERSLAPLRAADRGSASRLVESLRCYVRRDGAISEAAEELGVHRNTLCKRLARVERLLTIDLKSIDDLVDVRLAFDADEVLAGRRGVGV